MLSSPLRRCAVTGLVMPNHLMFALVPFASKEEKEHKPQEVAEELREHESSLRIGRETRAGARWARRHAQPSLLNVLAKAKRSTMHKIVTSQTSESKARFERQLEHLNRQIQALQRPRKIGRRFLVARLGADRKRMMRLHGTTLARNGRATWIMLEQSAVQALLKQRKERRFDGASERIVDEISEQLEEDTLTFLHKVVRSLKTKGLEHLLMPFESGMASGATAIVTAAIFLTDKDSTAPHHNVAQYHVRELFKDEGRREQAEKILSRIAQTSDMGVLVSQSPKTSELCTALWRLQVWRNGAPTAHKDSSEAENS